MAKFKKTLPLVLPILLAFAGASLAYVFNEKNSIKVSKETQPGLELGKDYYIQISLVELASKPEGKSTWDKLGSAPDIYVEIKWRENIIFKSSVKSDTLIGVWSQTELDLQSLAMGDTTISPDDLIKGARVSAVEGESIALQVYDYDPLGANDLAGSVELVFSSLNIGKNKLNDLSPGLRRVEILVSEVSEG